MTTRRQISSDFATVLDHKTLRAARRLFMTATPRVFTKAVRKQAEEADVQVASMDNEAVFGPVLHQLSCGEAIRRDLLTDYQIAVIGVDDATYRSFKMRNSKLFEARSVMTFTPKREDHNATFR